MNNNKDYIFKSERLSLRRDTDIGQGKESTEPYLVIECQDGVNIVAIDEQDRILVIDHYRYPVDLTLLEIPGGAIEDDESRIEAARRELWEETGYVAEDLEEIICVYANASRQSNRVWTFLAKGLRQNRDVKNSKCKFITIDKLIKNIQAGNFSQGLHVASVLFTLQTSGILQ